MLETDYISRFVKIGKDLLAIPNAEIEIMQRILGEISDLEIEQNRFYEGDEVLISKGNLIGLVGKLVSFQGKEKVVVQLNNIGYSIQMEMDKSLLTKVI